ncbi:cytochrome p450 oxidoreductase [Fusarium flagelliforme]|uniref:Cytochrome p450 oxidoreductase n=1 Tax=Fusarium flagelliforme TaxID=2675880 RepID=A0A395MTX9_9HYPO|nr:cytochrome p450 oxidoreductase [Fusarium flagelliforme]
MISVTEPIMALLSLSLRDGIILAAVAIIFLYIWEKRTPKITRNGEALRKPPNTLPLVGNGIIFLQPRQKLFSWFHRCERLYGYETLHITVPSLPPGVIVNDPQNLDFIFRNEGVFEKGDFFKQRSWDLFGHGIINVDGEFWRLQRKAGLRFLSAAALKTLTSERLPKYLEQAIDVLKGKEGGGEVVDLQAVVHEVTTQLMGRMAYNMEMHADDDFTVAFEHASGATAERFQNPLWFLTEMFTGARMRRSIATVKAYGKRIVTSAVADRKAAEGKTQSDAPGSLIQSLLDSIGDETLVADAALNYLSAGRDTVAQALTWTLYLLMKHPHVATKLCESVESLRDEAGTKAENDPETLTPVRLPYVLAVFYESLRLRPPIPFEIKQAQQATTLPDGTFLPAGAIVVWCAWAMGRSHTTWGLDADEFRPERWLTTSSSGDVTVAQRPASEFPVFNGGPRVCLGKKMAELVAVQSLARLVPLFDFEPAFKGERVSKSSLTLPMEGGLPVYVQHRESPSVS